MPRDYYADDAYDSNFRAGYALDVPSWREGGKHDDESDEVDDD